MGGSVVHGARTHTYDTTENLSNGPSLKRYTYKKGVGYNHNSQTY